MELNEIPAISAVLNAALKKAGIQRISTFLRRKNSDELEFTIKIDNDKQPDSRNSLKSKPSKPETAKGTKSA